MIPYENWHIGSTLPDPPTATERRHGRLALLLIAAVFLTLAFAFAGCATRPLTDARANAELQAPPVGLDSMTLPQNVMTISAPALLPRLTDAIGLSTREGRARRQARKDVAAAVPKKLGKGAQYAPLATQAVNGGNKSNGPTTAAGPGATVSNAAENSQQQNVQGDGNELTADKHDTTQQAKDWKAELATPVGKAVAVIVCLIAVAVIGGICYYLIPLLPKRRKDPVA